MNDWTNRLGNPQAPGDYMDAKSGLLMCGACGEPKQHVIDLAGTKMIVPCACRCTREQDKARKEALERQRAEYELSRRRCECFGDDLKKAGYTFAADDRRSAAVSDTARGYANDFADQRKQGKGLLFLGAVGTGKTFYACCIANAVIDAGYSAIVTNFAEIANDLQATFDKGGVHKRLLRTDLLVLDDLAAERDTSFMQEIVFQVIEERSAAGKPMILTSNLSPQEFLHPAELSRDRVFSRVAEVCTIVSVTGIDRRMERRKMEQREDRNRLTAAANA